MNLTGFLYESITSFLEVMEVELVLFCDNYLKSMLLFFWCPKLASLFFLAI